MSAEIDRSSEDLTVTPQPSSQVPATHAEPSGPPAATGRDADLITSLRSLRALGRFEDAAALVRAADVGLTARTMSAEAHAAAGPALAAVSEYAAAGVHLLLASMDPTLAPDALGQLAQLAWIERDFARGRAFALAGLALDPSHRTCRIQLQRNENEHAPGRTTGSGGLGRPAGGAGLSHAAFFADPQGNAGDRVLTDAVRRCFTGAPALTHGFESAAATDTQADTDQIDQGNWHDVHVHQLFDERRLAAVNATEGLIVGGGGLFLPDTAPNGNSGWQWNIADDVLARIAVPLVVFAVGYNMFEGQSFEGQTAAGQVFEGTTADGEHGAGGRFARSLRALVERSTFVGLRNHGSVDRVRELLPGHLADRIGWQPCPTAITDLLADPPGRIELPGTPTEPGAVLLNCAYDRAGRRFGDDYGTFLGQLRDWLVSTREQADLRYVAHCVDDERFVSDLRREHGLTLPVIAMYNLTPAQIHEHYRQARLVVGMRGHAGMIPFGCGTPIISLISHPKLGYFLDDIERPQWGVRVRDPQLAPRLAELTTELLDNQAAVAADIATIQLRLAAVTAQNLRSLPAALQPARGLRQDKTSE
jgi:hypothetical protein